MSQHFVAHPGTLRLSLLRKTRLFSDDVNSLHTSAVEVSAISAFRGSAAPDSAPPSSHTPPTPREAGRAAPLWCEVVVLIVYASLAAGGSGGARLYR